MPVNVLALKAAIRRLIKDCGGQESCVLIEGIGNARHQYFSEAGNPALPDKLLRLDQVAMLEADCGAAHVTRELARASGHILVKSPRPMAADVPDAALISIIREQSAVSTKTLEAHADGRLSTDECLAIEESCDRLVEAALQHKLNVMARRLAK